MKPIRQARALSRDGRGVVLDCGDDITMRIVTLAEDLVRVTALRGGAVRQKRTWCFPPAGTWTSIGRAGPGSTIRPGRRPTSTSRPRPGRRRSSRARYGRYDLR
jgi:hypothetical protein